MTGRVRVVDEDLLGDGVGIDRAEDEGEDGGQVRTVFSAADEQRVDEDATKTSEVYRVIDLLRDHRKNTTYTHKVILSFRHGAHRSDTLTLYHSYAFLFSSVHTTSPVPLFLVARTHARSFVLSSAAPRMIALDLTYRWK